MFNWGKRLSEQDRITKNVINLLSIKKNEVCFDRGMGQPVDYIDKPFDKITSEMISDVIDMIEEKEPRAQINVEDIININLNGDYNYKVVITDV